MTTHLSRRNFLRAAPAVAAAPFWVPGLALAEAPKAASQVAGLYRTRLCRPRRRCHCN
jgi:hypothetical protein